MSAHLDEASLEALASGRTELSTMADARAHVERCAECATRLEESRESLRDASVALRRLAGPRPELEAMLGRALAQMPQTPAPRVGRGALAAAGGVALTLAALLLIGDGGATLEGLRAFARQTLTFGRAIDHLVEGFLPGGWTAVGASAALFALLAALPLRRLLGPGAATTAAALLALGTLFGASSAHAYRLEGSLPEPTPTATVSVENAPRVEALRQASESAGLGLLVEHDPDPEARLTLNVRDVPLDRVLDALLEGQPVVVHVRGPMLVLRAEASEPATAPRAEAVAPAPVAPAAAAVERARPTPSAEGLSDRITFGGGVEVGEHEVVRQVVTMGGDAHIRGRAVGDVVTMGGDARVDGEVIGNVLTMGGDIHLGPSAEVHGDVNATGGAIQLAPGARVHGQTLEGGGASPRSLANAARGRSGDAPGWLKETFDSALRYVLLFLLGLVFLGTASRRFSILKDEVRDRPGHSAVVGIFASLALFAAVVVLTITLIGIPIAIVLAVVGFAALYVGLAAAAWRLGYALPWNFDRHPILALALGTAALFLISLIPIVGGLIHFVLGLIGFGAVISSRFGKRAALPTPRRAR